MAIRFDDIGNRLKAFRLGSGLSADEIASRLGISRTALYRFEKGELAKIETLEKLAELLAGVGADAARSRRRIHRLGGELFRAHAADRGDLRAHHRAGRADLLSAGVGRLRPRRSATSCARAFPTHCRGRKRALEQVDEIMAVLRQRKEQLSAAPARHRQPDLGDRDGALPEQWPGRTARSAGEDPPRAPRAGARRGRAFRRADGERADRRADRHRARHAAACRASRFSASPTGRCWR